jgi:hypothetical protein
LKGLLRAILFGNYFYGLCTIALSIEAGLQLLQSFNSFSYYLLVFAGTVIYYTNAYIVEPAAGLQNKRAIWYVENKLFVKYSQLLMTVIFVAALFYMLIKNWQNLAHTVVLQWVFIAVFPIVAAFYYRSVAAQFGTKTLRSNGWLKPLVIGFVWAGVVTVYPALFNSIEKDLPYTPHIEAILLFINNFMYITLLCIMFDIKDYAADHNQQLKTFVVTYGLRRTIFYLIIPLSTLGLGTFIMYGLLQHLPQLRLLINIFPFILLIIVAYSLHQRKSILYYLAIIDGLMLIKAICGIIGLTLIK